MLGFGVAALVAVASVAGCSGDDARQLYPSPPGPDGDAGPDVVTPVETVAAPVFDLAGGTFNAAQSVGIHTTTEGATIRYTLDGTTPGSTSPIYATPLSIATTTTIHAIALKQGLKDSAVQLATYVIDIPKDTVAPVQFGTNAGDYANDITVPLSSSTTGATICYTLDNSAPVCDTGARCASGSSTYDAASPVRITETGKSLHAVACKRGMAPSSETHADYTLTAAAPVFGPETGPIDPSKPLQVSVSTSTVGGKIHYTTDGSAPDCRSHVAPATGQLPDLPAQATTLKAVTCKHNYAISAVASAEYSLGAVCRGNFDVTTQGQLDSLSRCVEIDGSLRIKGSNIRDLAPLRNLTTISQYFSVGSTSLTSLDGLNALTKIGGGVDLRGNSSLARIDALGALKTVGGVFFLVENAVSEWEGPNGLTRIGGLVIGSEKRLQRIGGFAALAKLDDGFVLVGNTALATFEGMPAVTAIRGGIMIASNDALESVSVFPKARELGGLLLWNNNVLSRFAAFGDGATFKNDVQLSHNPKLSQLELHGVKSIGGILAIRGGMPSLTSLRGLRGLTSIKHLDLGDEVAFSDLRGLEGLTTVEGILNIARTKGLTSLAGLEGLKRAASVNIEGNENLQTLRGLDGLEELTSLYRSIAIMYNYELKEIGSLNALKGNESSISIFDNPRLEQLNGLHHLRQAHNIYLEGNISMTKLGGLEELTRVATDLRITESGLVDLTGLEALQAIGGDLVIQKNKVLTRLDALGQLTSLGEDLTITENATLPTCQANGIVTTLKANGYQGAITIDQNGGTCAP